MVEPNENFVILLTLFMFYFSLPKFLLLFGGKAAFHAIYRIPNSVIQNQTPYEAFLGHLQTITTFASLTLPVLFFFSHISITNLSLGLDFVAFLAMTTLKRDIGVMILSLIIFVSHAMLSFGNIAPLSSSLTFVPPYLPPLS